jgi:S-adenosylmethionine/arginine decarboxylase-like enzyme
LDGWKPIRRVLHFTTINVSTCKKFIDPWELLTDCLESLKSHREAMADK